MVGKESFTENNRDCFHCFHLVLHLMILIMHIISYKLQELYKKSTEQ